MKNLKKLVSVALSLAMVLSTLVVSTSAASYSDVDSTSSYYEAVEVLSGLKILEGDEEGNFNPEAEIKRSEFAAVISRMLGQENAAQGSTGYSTFPDVAADHWAVGYINWAAQQGIVNGRDDGTFDADAPVKFSEAIKMIVAALGYEPLASRNGGYPTGYMTIASSEGIISSNANMNADSNATRQVVAQLTYNALDVPLMAASYITANGYDEYTIYNGTNGYELRTVLSYYLDIAKVRATVTATPKSLDTLRRNADSMQVRLELTNCYDFYWDEILDGSYRSGDTLQAYIGDTDAADYLGYEVVAYIGESEDNDGTWTLAALVPDLRTTEVLTIDSNFDVADYTAKTFTYYEDDQTSRVDTLYLTDDFTLYINGEEVADNNKQALFESLPDEANSITFLGQRSQGEYDRVFATIYDYRRVRSVDVENEYIRCESGSVDLSQDGRQNNRFIYALYDSEGNEITLEDIVEGDILNIVAPGGDVDSASYLDIYVTNETVEGTVSEVSGDRDEFIIGGVEYEKTQECPDINVGDEGIFYLTIDGRIFDREASASLSTNYAFIIAVDSERQFSEDTWQVKLYDYNGSIGTYTVASSLIVRYPGGTGRTTLRRTGDELQSYLFDADAPTTYPVSGGEEAEDIPYAPYNLGRAIADQDKDDLAIANIQNRFVTFQLNSSNEIREISFAATNTASTSIFNSDYMSSANYSPSTDRLGRYFISDNSQLFITPVTEVATGAWNVDEDDIDMMSFESLDEDMTGGYSTYFYNVDSNNNIGAAVVTNDDAIAVSGNALAVVISTATGLDSYGDTADTVRFLQGTETQSLIINSEVRWSNGTSEIDPSSDLKAGDIFQYSTNGAGEIIRAETIYSSDLDTGIGTLLQTTGSSDITFAYGVVTDVDSRMLTLQNGTVDSNGNSVATEEQYLPMTYDDGTTWSIVDMSRINSNASNAVRNVGGIDGLRACNDRFTSNRYLAVAMMDDDTVTNVVEYLLPTSTTNDDINDASELFTGGNWEAID